MTHVVIIPILSNANLKPKVLEAAAILATEISTKANHSSASLPYPVGVFVDTDDTKQAGWKFHEYELIGIPLRIEIGPRDLEKNQAVLTRRDTGIKEILPLDQIAEKIPTLLKTIQTELLERARTFREQNTFNVTEYAQLKEGIENQGGFYQAPWCQSKDCEAKIKEEIKATIRCLPLDPHFEPIHETAQCIVCGNMAQSVRAIFALSY
jgi:prolyl-tRNA synthetase